ncbi:HtrA2 peptidase [Stanieria cyanosphaera PCC 7437]|uniref:HtrA2 peptidase n=1 Tax=Stanieria cyanosphaera (strain ATCC 29371 / PCC 7437) TaxID=111780 RepID=K9XQX2_STAC7|nr:HhoA/HhoB/HtrA family serine endopeptidase [Stanieria cyanosphaera]AFZ34461.1 HtrA2 peptidase [Stanieria cyanosphaera PCC 7437]
MEKSGFLGKVVSHFVALLLGVGLTFGGIKVMSSQADPLTSPSAVNPQNNAIALQLDRNQAQTATNFVSSAIAKTGPAVVRIDTEKTVTRRIDPLFEDPFFRDFFGDRFAAPIPEQRQLRGQGSGFIIDPNGIILTNAHVVSQADRVVVTLKDGREFEGKVQGTDEVTDLAVVKIEPKGAALPVAPLGDSTQVQVGDWAIAVGNPIGLNNTVTLGIISTLSRSSAQVGIPDKRVDFLQTDAAINPGNSGGPLLNERGEVIGINTAIRADANGIGFAIPINKAKTLKDTLAAGQQVPHPYVGIQMVSLTPELARQNNQDPNSAFFVPETAGVLVVRVMPNTPAEKGGVRRGDVILSVDGEPVTTADRLQSIVENSGVNHSLQLEILRGGLGGAEALRGRRIQLKVVTAQLQGMPRTAIE